MDLARREETDYQDPPRTVPGSFLDGFGGFLLVLFWFFGVFLVT